MAGSPITPVRPFRFGLHFWQLPVGDWRQRVRRYEALGYDTVTLTDHLVVPQWEPLAGLSALAAVTDRLRVGSLVLDMGLRDPVLTAKAAATVHRLSGGRLELGLGAGYVAANFAAAGRPFAPAGDRVARLEEAVTLIRQLWSQPATTFAGRFFDVVDSPMATVEPVSPRLLIGGGGPRVMRLGGQAADTVSMIPRQASGEWSVADSLADATVDRMAEKAVWVRQGATDAGRDPAEVELHTMVVKVVVGDDPDTQITRATAATAADGVSLRDAEASTLYLLGDGEAVRARLRRWRATAGISYVSFFDPGEQQIAWLAEQVVAPLVAEG
ncbi:MAG TPA: TIGR03621 family F420-dependent LLM class oxidoreductase [Acidimicrobiales bacterium]|nr:TIGR03621 family F420-dependent LLM class oxidoreductase [Acidimicrobiales bacterium]